MDLWTSRSVVACAVGFVLLSSAAGAAAQEASIAGTVRDGSGAVLPGVAVEASSPVLIEKVRAATSDGSGQYRITNLLPGLYTVTFSLPGFSTLRREGVEVASEGTVPINADMKVGGVE